ncbi:hypothetical protein [Microcystis aeruginosa]|nr:hypothetical protein [Microcystis aeruginosa]
MVRYTRVFAPYGDGDRTRKLADSAFTFPNKNWRVYRQWGDNPLP